MDYKGKFIVLEGGEGSGKGMCINYLKEKLDDQNIVFTREPGGTRVSEAIRAVLMNKDFKEITAKTELFLFCAARCQHIDELVRPSIDAGKNVICDRFETSTYSYQIVARERPELEELFWQLNSAAKGDIEPDCIIYLDVSPEEGIRRKSGSDDGICTRFDEEKNAFHEKVRQGYLTQFEKSKTGEGKTKWHLVETEKYNPKEVREKVLEIVKTFLQ